MQFFMKEKKWTDDIYVVFLKIYNKKEESEENHHQHHQLLRS